MSAAPERTLPQTIEQAMSDLLEWSCEPEEVQGVYKENLRHAIRAALEPERALRERCERLRQIALIAERFYDAALDQSHAFMDIEYLEPGDLADNLTAMSSAEEK